MSRSSPLLQARRCVVTESQPDLSAASSPDPTATPRRSLAPLRRAFTSSLFAFAIFTLWGAGVSQYAAKQLLGAETGIAFSVVETAGWALAAFMGGFVAGYRAAGRGWITGLLVGAYTDLSLSAFLYYAYLYNLGTANRADFDFLIRITRLPGQEFLTLVSFLLAIPISSILGGRYGDLFNRDHWSVEDPKKHSLFTIPWWHWTWLLLFLPPLVINDVLQLGHLVALGFAVAILSSIHLTAPPLVTGAAVVELIVIVAGLAMLWQAVSLQSKSSNWKRIGGAAAGVVLLVLVANVVWEIASPMLRTAIDALPL